MKNLPKKEDDISKELKRLEDGLAVFCGKELLEELKMPEKEDVKVHLMNMIRSGKTERRVESFYGLNKLVGAIRGVTRNVFVPDWARVMMKERILEYADSRAAWSADNVFSGFGSWYKRALALLVLTVFSFTIVAVFPQKSAVVYAKATYLEDLTGGVYVKRQLEMIKAYPHMILLEGDTVVSEGGSTATVRFFDESVGRINEHTRMRIATLHYDYERPVFSEVAVFLENGRLWAKVMNLTDESTFDVMTEKLSAGVDSKAVFDVAVDSSATRVAVFENVVKVSAGGEKPAHRKTVIAGYRAEVATSADLSVGERGEDMKIEKMSRNETHKPGNEWIASNLHNDREYVINLIADKENLIETGGAGETATVKSLTLSGAEGPAEKFETAYKMLTEAQVLLVRGERKAAAAGLEEFSSLMNELIGELPTLAEEDQAAAASLKNLMKDRIALQLKEMSSFLPDNSLYKAKETVQEIELALAESEVARAEIRLKQAGGILLEVETLIALNKPHLASTLLKRYQNRTNNITLTLTEENVKEVRERFVDLMKGQSRHMKTLTAIENSIVYLNQNDLKERVKDVREDTLRKFLTALERMPEMVPVDVLYEVNDLYATYVTDQQSETDIIEPAFAKLSGEKSKGLMFLSPDLPELPNEMGIFVMVPMEGTANVQSRVELWSDTANGKNAKNKSD